MGHCACVSAPSLVSLSQVPAGEIFADLESASAEGSLLEPPLPPPLIDASPPESGATRHLRGGTPLRTSGGRGLSTVREKVSVCASAYEACEQAHAIIVCTEWQEFKVLMPDF